MFACFSVIKWKPFGVKAAWWGHPITSGIESIDFFFSLDDELPAADSHYSEQLVRFDTINTMNLRMVEKHIYIHTYKHTVLKCIYTSLHSQNAYMHTFTVLKHSYYFLFSVRSLAERELQEGIVQQGRFTRACKAVYGSRSPF